MSRISAQMRRLMQHIEQEARPTASDAWMRGYIFVQRVRLRDEEDERPWRALDARAVYRAVTAIFIVRASGVNELVPFQPAR